MAVEKQGEQPQVESEDEENEEDTPPKDEEEREEAEKNRNYEYMKWRRDFDNMKREQEGIQAESDKMKAQGNQFFQMGCYMQASMIYSEALELQPDSAVLYCNRAMAYLKQDMPNEALADAEKSLEIDATVENIKAYWRKSQSLLELDRAEDAEAAAEEGMALQPGNAHLNRVRRKAREAIATKRLVGGEWVGEMQNSIEKRLTFAADGTMTLSVFGHKIDATYDLSVECNPQVMHVKMKPDGAANGSGPPPPPLPYIFEFHDDAKELWVCHPVGTTDLPTSFEGPGFDRMRRASDSPRKEEEDAEPLDVRCARYMQEMNEAMPMLPPQLPARPSDEEVSEEALLMEKISKLRRRYGMPVHQRALELAKAPHLADSPELSELALQLQRRLVARKVISSEVVQAAKMAAANPTPEDAQSERPVDGSGGHPLAKSPGKSSCLAGIVSRFCGR
mmetsp:Transcript_33012/g.102428  ORF Transcript_33012/g.102428 Transcript_33012/m.102428 type:complete len:450 (+) Transcript_33012:50-1399(+)|eukprot:CAMPEP_0204517112 /NCGR_PEP_ID=MMETSP0661-20131031/3493_1 /ASSEMBLY_ACC=CAM_ASM_000606 /TAXON_ID=109239 /ORGANISM="Alexandrium margalefi, Strain AMGDE01CS-322" /LENGTH=449 /DNA_ID=CAMNT_0051522499 /DNA_START=50 /DNA_END=1399 /DNA_ORIENTATION=-